MHALMLIVTCCWAANIIAVKEALRAFTPIALLQVRQVAAAVVFAVLFGIRRKSPKRRLTRHDWVPLVVLALTGVFLNQLFFVTGVARTSVAHASLIGAVTPIIVLVLASVLRLEVLTVTKFVGMLVSFAGIAVLNIVGSSRGNGGYWLGDLLLLGGGMTFACYTIQAKKVGHQYGSLTLNTLTYGLGSLLMLPFGWRPALATHWSAVTPPVACALAYTVLLGSVVPYTIYIFVLNDLAASRAAAFIYIQPVIATSLGIWILGERLTSRVFVGGVLILLGVYLAERERGEEKQPQSLSSGAR